MLITMLLRSHSWCHQLCRHVSRTGTHTHTHTHTTCACCAFSTHTVAVITHLHTHLLAHTHTTCACCAFSTHTVTVITHLHTHLLAHTHTHPILLDTPWRTMSAHEGGRGRRAAVSGPDQSLSTPFAPSDQRSRWPAPCRIRKVNARGDATRQCGVCVCGVCVNE